MLYLQLPAINFVFNYLTERIKKIVKFFAILGIVIVVIIIFGIIILGLIKQTIATGIALILFGASIWLHYFPPEWFSNIIKKLKKE